MSASREGLLQNGAARWITMNALLLWSQFKLLNTHKHNTPTGPAILFCNRTSFHPPFNKLCHACSCLCIHVKLKTLWKNNSDDQNTLCDDSWSSAWCIMSSFVLPWSQLWHLSSSFTGHYFPRDTTEPCPHQTRSRHVSPTVNAHSHNLPASLEGVTSS